MDEDLRELERAWLAGDRSVERAYVQALRRRWGPTSPLKDEVERLGSDLPIETLAVAKVEAEELPGIFLVIVGNVRTLSTTNTTATTFATLNVPTSNSSGGCIIYYLLEANDGTNRDSVAGQFSVGASNKAGVVTATSTAVSIEAANNNSGTLTAGATTPTITGTSVNLRVTPVWTVIVPTSVRLSYTIVCFGDAVTITPQ